MRPGPHLDAQVDQHLFGMPIRWGPPPYVTLPRPTGPVVELPYRYGDGPDGCAYQWARVPAYSRDIRLAWAVVERIQRPPQTAEEAAQGARWRFAQWWRAVNLWAFPAEDAAFAICREALLAWGVAPADGWPDEDAPPPAVVPSRVADLGTAYDLLRATFATSVTVEYAGRRAYRGHISPATLRALDELRGREVGHG